MTFESDINAFEHSFCLSPYPCGEMKMHDGTCPHREDHTCGIKRLLLPNSRTGHCRAGTQGIVITDLWDCCHSAGSDRKKVAHNEFLILGIFPSDSKPDMMLHDLFATEHTTPQVIWDLTGISSKAIGFAILVPHKAEIDEVGNAERPQDVFCSY